MNKNIFVLCIVYVLNINGMQETNEQIDVLLTVDRNPIQYSDIPRAFKANHDKLCKKFGITDPESETEWVKVMPLVEGLGAYVHWTESLPGILERKFGNSGSISLNLPITKEFLHPQYLPARYFKFLQGEKNMRITTTVYGHEVIYYVSFNKTDEELKLESQENTRKTIYFVIGGSVVGIGLFSLIATIIYYQLRK